MRLVWSQNDFEMSISLIAKGSYSNIRPHHIYGWFLVVVIFFSGCKTNTQVIEALEQRERVDRG